MAVARFERPGRGEQPSVQRQQVGLGQRALVGHRHAEQDLALPLGVADRPPAGRGLRRARLARERRALVEQGDDPPVERVDPAREPAQLRRLGRSSLSHGRHRTPGDRLEREVVAPGALADDRLDGDVGRKLTCRNGSRRDGSERWTSMNGRWTAEQRVAQRDARVGQPAGVDDRDVEVAPVQPVDEGALVVRLEEVDLEAELVARAAIPAWISSSVS